MDRDRNDRKSDESLTAAVMTSVRERIAARNLTPGDKLPSIRSMAHAMKVSSSTVVEAYDRLVSEGVIRSRPGSGFFVAKPWTPLAVAQVGPRLDRAIDPFWISRHSLDAGDTVLKPGCGWLPASWLPEDALRRALRTLARQDEAGLADYGTPLGHGPLRQLLARRLSERGVETLADQVMLTESGTHAIDLLCRFLIEPGDTVLVDDPCYFNFHALLRAHRARIVGVPYTASGPDVAQFENVLSEHRPRVYITNSAIHNPTGATLSPTVARRILKLAEQAQLTLIEDDIFADFEHEPAPRLVTYDGLDRVVSIGSFSKTLSAAARIGYIVARADWIESLTDLKIATSFGGGRLASELVFGVLRDGSYRKHMEKLRLRLAHAMSEVSARLQTLGIVPWLRPTAGMFLWCRLPEGIDASDLARRALREDIVLAPGNAFSLSQSATAYMRFNVAQSLDSRLFDFLAEALKNRGAARNSANGPRSDVGSSR